MPGFSLWMMPPPAIGERFRALIADLSRRSGTPAFEPHLTLAGVEAPTEAAACSRVAPLAAALAPLPVRLTDIGMTADYFRCLFIRAALTPALTQAYRSACAALDQTPAEFMPHLSLIYGELAPAAKAEIAAALGGRFDIEFTVERLALYTTTGAPPDWRCVCEFQLGGGDANRCA